MYENERGFTWRRLSGRLRGRIDGVPSRDCTQICDRACESFSATGAVAAASFCLSNRQTSRSSALISHLVTTALVGVVVNGSLKLAGLVMIALRVSTATGAPLECRERIPEMTALKSADDVGSSRPIFCNLTPMTELRRSCSSAAVDDAGYLNEWLKSFLSGDVGGAADVRVGVSDSVRAAELVDDVGYFGVVVISEASSFGVTRLGNDAAGSDTHCPGHVHSPLTFIASLSQAAGCVTVSIEY